MTRSEFVSTERPNSVRLGLALIRLREVKAHVARYDESVEEYRRQGYRPRHCIHGTDLWVDYDPICHWCEEGVTLRGHNAYVEAFRQADEEIAEHNRRHDIARPVISEVRDTHPEIASALIDWVLEPVSRKQDRGIS